MQIPTQRQWLQDTNAGVLKPRSSKLKAVDMALLNYELAKGTRLGLLGEAKRMWSTVSPLADLKDLIGLKS